MIKHSSDRFVLARNCGYALIAISLSACDSSGLVVNATEVTVDDSDDLALQSVLQVAVLSRQAAAVTTEEGLLINGDFSEPLGTLPGWSACVDNNALQIESTNRVAQVGARECILQVVDVKPGSTNTFSCEVSASDPNQWSGMAISFYDANGEFISESDTPQVTSNIASRETTVGTAPANTNAGLVWFYTESGGTIDNCTLESSYVVDEPQPEVPEEPPEEPNVPEQPPSVTDFCPAYDESPLYRQRSNIQIVGPDDNNWELKVQNAPADTEILFMDGEYLLDLETITMRNPDITIRSLSGNRDGVVIRGIGIEEGTSEGFMIAADRITISDITMHSMRRHAVAMKPGLDNDRILDKVYVYNLNVYDTGTQHIKAADSGENRDTVVACSRIGYTPGAVKGDYIGGIGIFEGTDVIVRDNYLYNITGDGTGCNAAVPEGPCVYDTGPAIYMRVSRDSIVERNTIIDSWRGISLGLTNGHTRGIIRNNFVYREAPGDMGISVERSTDTIIEHNTVFVNGYWAPIEARFGSGHIFRNNLTSLPIRARDGATNISIEGNGNIEFGTINDLASPYDPHLKPDSQAIGTGVAPSAVTYDIDGQTRSGRWDVGADQFSE